MQRNDLTTALYPVYLQDGTKQYVLLRERSNASLLHAAGRYFVFSPHDDAYQEAVPLRVHLLADPIQGAE